MRNSAHDDEHLLTTEHNVECCERAHIMANRVQYSRGYFYFYGLLIALNVFLLAWVFVEADYVRRATALPPQPPPCEAPRLSAC